jgi:hypothetical protein
MKAKLVWISIYLDDKNIFYINRLHKWESVDDKNLKNFLNEIFELDILIIGHNIKYDLEIIELFLSGNNNKKEVEENFWQISLGL